MNQLTFSTSHVTGPKVGDLLIRDVSPLGEFIIVDATTLTPLRGPFESLSVAAADARSLCPHGTIWKENIDQRGRSLGPPIPLPV